MKFDKRALLAVIDYEDYFWDKVTDQEVKHGLKKVSAKYTGDSRWSKHYDLIFRQDANFFRTSYSVGATETQDEGPFEYEGPEIECEEVEPYTETVVLTKYRAKAPLTKIQTSG